MMDPTEQYTAGQLREAAARLHTTVELVIGKLTGAGPWNTHQLRSAADRTGYNLVTLGRVIQDASEQAPVTEEDDVVITARELREALWYLRASRQLIAASRSSCDDFADQILHHAAGSREPEYSPGTVVRDEQGEFYQRTSYGSWLMFGTAHPFSHSTPLRPLEVISDNGTGT
jgi:hypothetical protein